MGPIITIWIASAIISAALLSRYNRAGTGLLLGGILGIIGLVIALVMRSDLGANERQKQHQAEMRAIAESVKAGGGTLPADFGDSMAEPPERNYFCLEGDSFRFRASAKA